MKVVFSIFPKFYKHLSVEQLAELVKQVGLDTTNLVVRDGYWCARKTLARDVPVFVKTLAKAGLKVEFATVRFSADEVIANDSPLAILAENGIKEFRMEYFPSKKVIDVRGAIQQARGKLERMVTLCQKRSIRAVYQLHHGTLIPSPSAAFHLVQGLPSRWMGVELDAGNQAFEGFERWGRACRLLGEYCVAMGVKDVSVTRDPARADDPDKGWTVQPSPLYEGITNWHDVVAALKDVNFDGTFVFMPYYDQKDHAAMTAKLKKEVSYLRKIVAAAGD
jgi:sugar phosphate isomerase/epimerase